MRIVFVSDYYVEDLVGGAELSLQTHINGCPYPYIKVKSSELELTKLDVGNDLLVMGNFALMSNRTMMQLKMGGWRYVIEECDYKFCKFRCTQLHEYVNGEPCGCQYNQGVMIRDLFLKAERLFWKSERQRQIYWDMYPELCQVPGAIMGGVFSDKDLDYIMLLKSRKDDGAFRNSPYNDSYAVLRADSWLKAYEVALEYCFKHDLPVCEIGNVPYYESLRLMSECKGIVYLPKGYDPSCRMMTEATLLGLDVITNRMVQHMTEGWFNAGPEAMLEFLRSRDKVFWEHVNDCVTVAA